MSYAALIRSIVPDRDPRHIEALMRVQHGTLDALSPEAFRDDVLICVIALKLLDGTSYAERVARSYGL